MKPNTKRLEGNRHSLGWIRVGLLALALAAPLGLHPSLADQVSTISQTLPTARYDTSAVWDGSHAYIFGGFGNGTLLDEIVRFDPVTGNITTMNATLPTGRTHTSAIWDGSNAYIFGGFGSDDGYLDQVVRYNTTTDTVTLMNATLPVPTGYTSAIWDGSSAYIFGGVINNGAAYSSQIVRYTPSTDTATLMSATFSTARASTSAIWDGSNAYIFGGSPSQREVVQYNPSSNIVTLMGASLPGSRDDTSAVWDGHKAFIFGNGDGREVVRYAPTTDTAISMSAQLPTYIDRASAIWDGHNAYHFGGQGGSNWIIRYDLTPGAPHDLVATAGFEADTIALTWQPPASNTYSVPPTNYTIYRGSASGAEAFLATVGAETTFVDENVTQGTRYFYQVTASNAAGESPLSNEISIRAFSELLAMNLSLLPAATPSVVVGYLKVCDSGSNLGCGLPGNAFACIDIQPTLGPAINLACLDHAAIPAQSEPLLHLLSPVPIGLPGPAGSFGSISKLQVTYQYDSLHLSPVASMCMPDVAWVLGHGDEVPLVVTLVASGPGGNTMKTTQSIPSLGQFVAAARATQERRCP